MSAGPRYHPPISGCPGRSCLATASSFRVAPPPTSTSNALSSPTPTPTSTTITWCQHVESSPISSRDILCSATHCNTLQHRATHCNTLYMESSPISSRDISCSAARCHTLQHTVAPVTRCNTLYMESSHILQRTASHCTTLHHTAPYCTTLHHTACVHMLTCVYVHIRIRIYTSTFIHVILVMGLSSVCPRIRTWVLSMCYSVLQRVLQCAVQ